MKKLFLIIAMLCSNAFADIQDLKIGVAQIFTAAYFTTTTTLNFNSITNPTLVKGGVSSVVQNSQLSSMAAAGQYFKLVKVNPDVVNNNYMLAIFNKDGSMSSVVSNSGPIIIAADGVFLYRSENSRAVFIFPNNGYINGSAGTPNSVANSYSNRVNIAAGSGDTANLKKLDTYIPPSDQPIQTGGKSYPLGTGFAGGGVVAVYASSITTTQQNQLNAVVAKVNSATNGNKVYLEEKTGTSGTIVNIEQIGSSNTVQNIGGGNATIQGSSNTINIKQGSSSTGKNMIEFNVNGNSNSMTVWQARNMTDGSLNLTGTDNSQHYAAASITGNSNTVVIKQLNASLTSGSGSGHFESLTVNGSNNNLTLTQNDASQKQFWGTVTGNNNILNVAQQGASTKYLDLSLTGNGNNATVTQMGTGAHKATISLTNGGGASTLNVTQQGATAQVYSISQTCTVATGCSASIVQGQ